MLTPVAPRIRVALDAPTLVTVYLTLAYPAGFVVRIVNRARPYLGTPASWVRVVTVLSSDPVDE